MADGDVPLFQFREGEDAIMDFIPQPGDEHIGGDLDGSEFLNDSGEGVEVERSDQGQTRIVGEPPQSGVVY